jgi:Protein of unknown function (DUF3889)
MKRIFLTLILTLTFASISPTVSAELQTHGKQAEKQPQIPLYAKWGTLAVKETSKKYPNANIIDYLHVGRKVISSSTIQETFKLWLRQGNREFGVIVRITFDATTEQVHSITFEETKR